MRYFYCLLIIVFLTTTAFQCQDGSKASIDIISLVYEFGDSSVPPQYHRSYTIIVDADSAHLTIDSYGDILAEESVAIPDDTFKKLLVALNIYQIKECNKKEDNEGCSGGTSESISYKTSSGESFDGTVYHCGGKDFGTLAGDTKAFAIEVKKLFPDFSKIMGATEE